jgi:hypothetical protein
MRPSSWALLFSLISPFHVFQFLLLIVPCRANSLSVFFEKAPGYEPIGMLPYSPCHFAALFCQDLREIQQT